jgi:hypothetical protein
MAEYLFIDIRKSDEVYSRRLDKSDIYDVYHIPMYMVRFNVEMIKKLNYKEIYIICHSAKRSKFIKCKYFINDNNIFVIDSFQFNKLSYGINKVILNNNNTIDVNIVGSNSYNVYSIMRITQIILGTLILIVGSYTLYSIYEYQNINKLPLIILLFFGFNALVNGLTSTCSISEIFVDYLN